MDFFLQKAKVFALETAKKSQEIANQAAKLSQELATETAKRSKELAIDVTKRADQLKAYAGELTPAIAAKALSAAPAEPSEEELEESGITSELREFVKGLTIKTFRDFPPEYEDGRPLKESQVDMKEDQITRQDLSDWQERHAVLVLLTVKEISDFRYVLCPRRMKESQFWKIYFTLVNSFVAPYEARAKEKECARLAEQVMAEEQAMRDLGQSPFPGHKAHEGSSVVSTAEESRTPEQDLDAYLMGVLDSSDEGAEGDDDDGFDADFDQLVNSTADSDVDDDSSHADGKGNKSKQSTLKGSKTGVTVSEGSSDGELVEIPDNMSDQASQK